MVENGETCLLLDSLGPLHFRYGDFLFALRFVKGLFLTIVVVVVGADWSCVLAADAYLFGKPPKGGVSQLVSKTHSKSDTSHTHQTHWTHICWPDSRSLSVVCVTSQLACLRSLSANVPVSVSIKSRGL